MAVDEKIRNCMRSAFVYFEKLSKVIPLSHGRESNFDENMFNDALR